MNRHTKLAARLASALIVAIGIAVAWGAVLIWAGSVVSQFHRGYYVYEDIHVLHDGSPCIRRQSYTGRWEINYRDLDGRPIQLGDTNELLGADFREPIQPPALYEPQIPWSRRIAELSDLKRTNWYLVRDAKSMGHAYFVAFDTESKRRVGYISRARFTLTMPERYQ